MEVPAGDASSLYKRAEEHAKSRDSASATQINNAHLFPFLLHSKNNKAGAMPFFLLGVSEFKKVRSGSCPAPL
jgi:hypothetical protein